MAVETIVNVTCDVCGSRMDSSSGREEYSVVVLANRDREILGQFLVTRSYLKTVSIHACEKCVDKMLNGHMLLADKISDDDNKYHFHERANNPL